MSTAYRGRTPSPVGPRRVSLEDMDAVAHAATTHRWTTA